MKHKMTIGIVCALFLSSLCGAMEAPVKLKNRQERPKLIKRVSPVYPPQAVKQKIAGRIAVEAVTDEQGNVVKATVIPADIRLPLLEEAALTAIRQWKYEPYMVEGKAKPVQFTVLIFFRLNGDSKEKKNLIPDEERPELVKKIAPRYPSEALKKHIQGQVKLEVTIDETGAVTAVEPLEGQKADLLLVEEAMRTVKQWVYEPYLRDDKAEAVTFEVTVTFKLNK